MTFRLLIIYIFIISCSVQRPLVDKYYQLKNKKASGYLILTKDGTFKYLLEYHSISFKSEGNYYLKNKNLKLASKFKTDSVNIKKLSVDSLEDINIGLYDVYSDMRERFYVDCEGIRRGSNQGIVKLFRIEECLDCNIISYNFIKNSYDTINLTVSTNYNYYEIRKSNTFNLQNFEDFSGVTINYKKRKITIKSEDEKLVFFKSKPVIVP